MKPAAGALRALLDAIDRGQALLPNGSLLLESSAAIDDDALTRAGAAMLLDQDDLASLRELARSIALKGRCHVHLRSLPPYVGGDDDDEIEGWLAECCACAWRGRETPHQAVAYGEAIEHLHDALASVRTPPGVFDLRRELGRAPTVDEYRASRES